MKMPFASAGSPSEPLASNYESDPIKWGHPDLKKLKFGKTGEKAKLTQKQMGVPQKVKVPSPFKYWGCPHFSYLLSDLFFSAHKKKPGTKFQAFEKLTKPKN